MQRHRAFASSGQRDAKVGVDKRNRDRDVSGDDETSAVHIVDGERSQCIAAILSRRGAAAAAPGDEIQARREAADHGAAARRADRLLRIRRRNRGFDQQD